MNLTQMNLQVAKDALLRQFYKLYQSSTWLQSIKAIPPLKPPIGGKKGSKKVSAFEEGFQKYMTASSSAAVKSPSPLKERISIEPQSY